MKTMPEKRWWCDWFLSPSEGEYFREDEIFFFRLLICMPFTGMLLSWLWWNNQILFPWWFSTSSAIILSLVCMGLVFYCDRFSSLTGLFICMLISPAFFVYTVMHIFILHIPVNDLCGIARSDDNLSNWLCWWPNLLWWAMLRDGLFIVIVMCSIVSLQFSHTPSLTYSEPFDDQLLNSLLTFNRRRERTRRRRRSHFIFHYVLHRMGQMRRRRRLPHN